MTGLDEHRPVPAINRRYRMVAQLLHLELRLHTHRTGSLV